MRTVHRTLISICCLLAPLVLALPGHTSGPPPLIRVRIAYQHRDELMRLEQAGVDIWEVHPGYAVAVISGAQEAVLGRQGYQLERLGAVSPLFTFDPQYHTYQEMVAKLQSLDGAYPDLLRLVSVGQSWETVQGRADRELWALKIRSDPEGADARPKVLFVAALHARELATVEVALKLAAHLLESYHTDADVAYLLDTRETWIVPMVNPDGHIHAEEGQSWRKNTNDSESPCGIPPNSYGVDLNRNFPYQWGGIGSGSDPCDLTYRGSGPLSEPEDQALTNLIQEQGFGLTVSYHSYGEMILYPWGYTTTPPSDEVLFAAIVEKMASHNGYRWGQSSEILYRTHGDLDDWAYQEVGALSFTVELGPPYHTCRGRCFDPPYSAVEGLWQENREPALYLLKIADDPTQAYGPEATDVALMTASRNLTLTAVLSDVYNGGEDIAAAELFVDVLGEPGTGWALAPADGAFDSPQEQVMAILSWPEPGRHTLYLRGKDAEGHWGPVSAAFWEGHRSFVPIAVK